jgi:hypothetical protein
MTVGQIFRFWLPLASTWLMMAAEGPIVAAVVARMPEATLNLAAFGVANALANLIEAPILMLLAASTALAVDQASYRSLKRFAFGLNALLTAVMLLVILPPVYRWLVRDLLALPAQVGDLSYGAVALLVPWPAAIGYRRFHQGLLVRNGMTRWVAYGTICRLAGILATVLLVPRLVPIRGAHLGGAALSIGVLAEALVTGRLAGRAVRAIDERARRDGPGSPLELRRILRFYVPLATTSILPMAVQPMLTFFMGQGRLPIQSLAVFPVALNFVFMFRCTGVSLQEVTIALAARSREAVAPLRRFATLLAGSTTGALAITAWTGLAVLWYEHAVGLPASLTGLAIWTTRVLTVLPALTVAQAFQRGLLVNAHRTAPISWATMIEVVVIATTMLVTMKGLGWPGAMAAAASVVCGQITANTFLNLMVRRPQDPRTPGPRTT